MPRAHPPEFRQRAVELARLREKPLSRIKKDLGISHSCLRAATYPAAVAARVIPRRTLPPGSMLIAFSPLLDERTLRALSDLSGRGHDVAVIEVAPGDWLRPGTREPTDPACGPGVADPGYNKTGSLL